MEDNEITFRSALDPYYLLKSYMREAKIKSKAYGYSENYYRNLNKIFTYPIVVISAVGSVLGGIAIHPYVSMGLSLFTLILTGGDRVVNTREKEQSASHMRIEYGEIAKNIKQYIYSNNRTKAEIKDYSSHICELTNKWNGIAPPVLNKFVKKASVDIMEKKRHSFKTLSPISDKKKLKIPEQKTQTTFIKRLSTLENVV